MYLETLKNLIPADFSDNSKVWVYQSSRRFTGQQQAEIDEQLHQFCQQWDSHGKAVKGWGKLLFGQFIVVLADMQGDTICGGSTDGMVRLIKSIERQYETNLFDRMTLTFLLKDEPQMLPMHQVDYALEKGYINADTPLFNNSITTKAELMSRWLLPLKDSWLASRLSLVA